MAGKRWETPWGYEVLFYGGEGESRTVKIIAVRPGQRLSLQRHGEREERWTVLSHDGGFLQVGRETFWAEHGLHVTIPKGEFHRMSAPPHGELMVLEIALGTFHQNDIERLEDDYGRV